MWWMWAACSAVVACSDQSSDAVTTQSGSDEKCWSGRSLPDAAPESAQSGGSIPPLPASDNLSYVAYGQLTIAAIHICQIRSSFFSLSVLRAPIVSERRQAARRVAAVFSRVDVFHSRRMSWLGRREIRNLPSYEFSVSPMYCRVLLCVRMGRSCRSFTHNFA